MDAAESGPYLGPHLRGGPAAVRKRTPRALLRPRRRSPLAARPGSSLAAGRGRRSAARPGRPRGGPGSSLPARWGLLLAALAALLAACGGHSATSTSTGPPSTSTSAPSTTAAGSQSPRAIPDGDWKTFDYGPQRAGVGPARTGITSANVSSLTSPCRPHRRRGRLLADPAAPRAGPGSAARRGHPDDHLRADDRARSGDRIEAVGVRPERHPQLSGQPADHHRHRRWPRPDRAYVYSASPDGVIHKLSAVERSRRCGSTRITVRPRAREDRGSAERLVVPTCSR